jgi:hypothetical protein
VRITEQFKSIGRIARLLCPALFVLFAPLQAGAELHSRKAGLAWYDDVLDITWVADANLANTETFGDLNVREGGLMKFNSVTTLIGFIAKMNQASYLGFNDWRAPTARPVSGVDWNFGCANNGSSDRGYAGSGGWVDPQGQIVSEMGHMYYVNLGNLGRLEPEGGGTPFCTGAVIQDGWGLANSGPFSNLQPEDYWTNIADPTSSSRALQFRFGEGMRDSGLKDNLKFVWPVRDGDMPDPDAPATAIGFAPNPINAGSDGALTGTANETNTGGSWVQVVQYRVAGGDWQAMEAQDGAYDSMTETGVAMLNFESEGIVEVCVRGQDQPGNISDPACIDVQVVEPDLPPLVQEVALIPDAPIPQGLLLEIRALANDEGRGGRLITSADFQLGAGPWQAMKAADDAFNSPREEVVGFLDTTGVPFGEHTLCVRATDASAQVSDKVCTSFEVVLVGNPEDFTIVCRHRPLWPQPGDEVDIFAQTLRTPLDGSGTPFGVDEIEIWFNDKNAPLKVASDEAVWSTNINVGAQSAGQFFYGCRATNGARAVFSGWRTTTVGSPNNDSALPVVITGTSDQRVDVVFVPDKDSFSGPSDPDFLQAAEVFIRDSFYRYEIFNRHQHLMNFWLSRNSGQAERLIVNGKVIRMVVKPSDWDENYAFADAGAIVHNKNFRDFAKSGMFTVEPGETDTAKHEAGHRPFGLADEYCCDGGYFETETFPNVYKTLDTCETDAPDLGRVAEDCRTWESSGEKDCFSSEPAGDDLMFDRGQTRAADIRRIEWIFQQCETGEC